MRDVNMALLEHMGEAQKWLKESDREADILGVFLYGSQNYNFADDASDVDTECIVVPSLKELCLNQPVSTEHELPNGEHVAIKDIRLAFKHLRKQNIDDVQLLFTDFYWINPKYADLWEQFLTYRNQIAFGDPYQAVKTIGYQIRDKIKTMGTNPKVLANCIRLDYFIEKYKEGADYLDCIRVPNTMPDGMTKDDLFTLKRCENYTVTDSVTGDLKVVNPAYQKYVDMLTQKYSDVEAVLPDESDTRSIGLMNTVLDQRLLDIIRHKISTETKVL